MAKTDQPSPPSLNLGTSFGRPQLEPVVDPAGQHGTPMLLFGQFFQRYHRLDLLRKPPRTKYHVKVLNNLVVKRLKRRCKLRVSCCSLQTSMTSIVHDHRCSWQVLFMTRVVHDQYLFMSNDGHYQYLFMTRAAHNQSCRWVGRVGKIIPVGTVLLSALQTYLAFPPRFSPPPSPSLARSQHHQQRQYLLS